MQFPTIVCGFLLIGFSSALPSPEEGGFRDTITDLIKTKAAGCIRQYFGIANLQDVSPHSITVTPGCSDNEMQVHGFDLVPHDWPSSYYHWGCGWSLVLQEEKERICLRTETNSTGNGSN
eukprot:TRINITY_DN7270_c0_g1_i1.p1 TRINITY_DN7270_c0_g1~~TRINITY_DN7270_c0_g1_i1.p1  ORF type:complete len:120 (-),score=8.02 TRINITY_DN7270_c0_g1_i1:22-381(-)